jgi:RecA-family ATPase
MDAIEQARRYVAAIPGAVSGSGGHNQTFGVACALVHGFALNDADAWAVLCEYNARCSPLWSAKELRHKLDSAAQAQSHEKPRGHLLSKQSVRYRFGASDVKEKHTSISYTQSQSTRAGTTTTSAGGAADRRESSAQATAYDLSDARDVPPPMPDGTRALLKALFRPGEGICICPATDNDEGREIPRDGGVTLSLEEWLSKLDDKQGDPNKIFFSRKDDGRGVNGIFFRINPMQQGRGTDADVTDLRHALIEFDDISKREQWALITKSRIPCTAVTDSGGKSLHALVRVDAQNRAEYAERVAMLYGHFAEHQRPDEKNKNPSRFSRLPNCMRGTQRQELLALNVGAASFTEWMAGISGDTVGDCRRFSQLMAMDTAHDPNCVIGFRDGKTLRYLCKGKSAWLLGPSGVGKSSLVAEFAIGWGLGLPVFGIQPRGKLKSIIVQAENDDHDLAEMVQGVASAHGLTLGTEAFSIIDGNVMFKTESTSLREVFVERIHRLVDRERPDLLWVDPLLSFAGIDVSKQDQCSEFLRTMLNPMLEATGVVMVGVHHTGKPKAQKDTKHWTAIDYAYSGLGSSELVNWARAVMVVKPAGDEGQFELKLAKRGSRAGATHLDGEWTTTVFLQHSKSGGVRWEQIDEPVKSRYSASKGFDSVAFMAHVGQRAMQYKALISEIEEFAGVKERKAKDLWGQVKENFNKDNDGFYSPKG